MGGVSGWGYEVVGVGNDRWIRRGSSVVCEVLQWSSSWVVCCLFIGTLDVGYGGMRWFG